MMGKGFFTNLFKFEYSFTISKTLDYNLLYTACEKIFNREGNIHTHDFGKDPKEIWLSDNVPELEVVTSKPQGQNETFIDINIKAINPVKTLFFYMYFILVYYFSYNFIRYFYAVVNQGKGFPWLEKVVDTENPIFKTIIEIVGFLWGKTDLIGSAVIIYGIPIFVMAIRFFIKRIIHYRKFYNEVKILETVVKKGVIAEEFLPLKNLPSREDNSLTFSNTFETKWQYSIDDYDTIKDTLEVNTQELLKRKVHIMRIGYMIRIKPVDYVSNISLMPQKNSTEIDFYGTLKDFTFFYTLITFLILYFSQFIYLHFFSLWDAIPHHVGSQSLPFGYLQMAVFPPVVLAGPLSPLIGFFIGKFKCRKMREKNVIRAKQLAIMLNSNRNDK